MSEHRRNTALAIKRCLDHLAVDARRGNMGELEELIGLAALAAADAADIAPHPAHDLINSPPQGHC